MASNGQVEIEINGDSKLHSMLRAIPQLPPPQDWRISRASRIREIVGGDDYDSNLVRIGPLHRRDARWDYGFVAAIKMLYLRSLILRGHASSEEAEVLTKYLRCIEGMADTILQRYDAPEYHFANPKELAEMMVFDGCFIIEVIVKYWIGKNREDSPPPDIDFVESDLISVENQIPFFVLEELFRTTVVPELATRDGSRELLRNLALFYLTRGAARQVPEGYNGPIYHLLHLLHISLCAPPQVIARPSPLPRKIKLLWRLTGRRSWAAPVSWLLWKVMPPARELQRLGVRFKPKMTHQFANITFDQRNGTLEIPPLSFSQFHRRLASNLVAMELEQSWPSTERHFCSYVMLVKELIATEEDVAMLVEKRILVCSAQEGWRGVQHFASLARLNIGGEYQRHFEELIREVHRHYEHASKAMRAVYFC